ncbi:MAG: hypothetical protein HYZ66_01240 [Chlamydiae bacterium]|nr:hypothetical protein [Chlamydiota bacterium]MBI3276361.1 hypothetical protein [Chlamydiota bacterium]
MLTGFESLISSLLKLFSAEKIEYVILGGVAVSIYGEPRFTMDVDVNVIMDQKKVKNFLDKAEKFYFFPLSPSVQKIAEEQGVIPLKFAKGEEMGKVDVIIAENPLEFSALQRGKIKKMGSLKARFITPEDLVLHKMTSARVRDHNDLKGIILRQKGKLDLDYIHGWLKRLDEVDEKLALDKQFNQLLKEC